jgi:diguanylate cyclase (GGDEF)-like protein
VPIRGEEDEAGIVWIFDDGHPFSQQELDRTVIVSDYARAALQNVERYRNAKERAFIDDVTEIYNVRYLLSTTENEIQRADRYENPLSVLFLDLDRFKLVNDRCGHLVGSQTLRSLSQLFLQCVRQVDTLARYGGDEFTILLVDTDHDAAMTIAQRIRRTVEANVFEAGADGTLRLTISIGVATFPEHARERDALLDAADKAMYRAKSLGRNRVCSASEL